MRQPLRRDLRRGAGLALGAALAIAACARVRPLEGGPPDVKPPRVLRVTPADSSTNIAGVRRFEIEFDEPLGSAAARSAVRFEPPVRVTTEAKGSKLIVTLADSLPPDTTVVMIIGKNLQDRRGRDNKLPSEVALLYATGPRLRAAAVFGRATLKGAVDPRLLVQWEPVPADTGREARLRRLPTTTTDGEGLFRLLGVPPDKRFRLRAFSDRNSDLRPNEDELAAAFPETLQLGPGQVRRGVVINVIDPTEAGTVNGVALQQTPIAGPVAVALRRVGLIPGLPVPDSLRHIAPDSIATRAVRADTLRPKPLAVPPRGETRWAPAYARLEPRGFVKREWTVVYASPRGDYSVRVPPGRHAVVAFVDVRRDSVPGLYVVGPDSTALAWEPFMLGDTLVVQPGSKVRARTLEIRAP